MLKTQVILVLVVRRFGFDQVGLGAPACDNRGEKILNGMLQYGVGNAVSGIMKVPSARVLHRCNVLCSRHRHQHNAMYASARGCE